MTYAEHEFRMSMPDQEGVTERARLQQIERQTKRRPKELDGPEFPTLMSNVWSAFFDLALGRTAGFSGPNPITYQDIKAWKDLTDYPLSTQDVEIIMRLDRVWMRVVNGR